LNHLNQTLTVTKLQHVLAATSKLSKNTSIRTYINVITEKNATTFQELMSMGQKVDAILKEFGFVDKWRAEGKTEGRAEGKAETIIRILSRRLTLPSKTLQKKIYSIRNIDQLDELTDFALTCVSLDEFMTALK
jgi:hypothetical protein